MNQLGVILDEEYVNKNTQSTQNLLKNPKNVKTRYGNLKNQYNSLQEDINNITQSQAKVGGGVKHDQQNQDRNAEFEELEYNDDDEEEVQKQKNFIKINEIFANSKSIQLPRYMQNQQSMFHEVERYLRGQLEANYQKQKFKVLNFTSPFFKKYKRELEHKNRKGYLSLQNKIRESAQLVSHIKTGKSLFQNAEIIKEYHIPVLKENELRDSLQQLLNKSQDEVSIKQSKKNLKLIECLSPEKHLKKYQNMSPPPPAFEEYNDRGGAYTNQSMITMLDSGEKYQDVRMSVQESNSSKKQGQQFDFVRQSTQLPTLTAKKESLKPQTSLDVYNQNITIINNNNNSRYQTQKGELSDQKKLKNLRNVFDFPNNPAYLNQQIEGRNNNKKLKYLTEYCKQNKIALSSKEELIMNLEVSKMQHNMWKDSMNHLFEYKKGLKDESSEMIELIKQFDALELKQIELNALLQNSKLRNKPIIVNQKLVYPKPKNVMEDENSILYQIKKISNQKKKISAQLDLSIGSSMKTNQNQSAFDNNQKKQEKQGGVGSQIVSTGGNGNPYSSQIGNSVQSKTNNKNNITVQDIDKTSREENSLSRINQKYAIQKGSGIGRSYKFTVDSRYSKNSSSQNSTKRETHQSGLNQRAGSGFSGKKNLLGVGTHQILTDQLAKIQTEKKQIEEERLKKYHQREKKRKEAFEKLQESLDNAFLLKHDQGNSSEEDENFVNYFEGERFKSIDVKEKIKKNKLFLRKLKKEPVMKLIGTTDNINKQKKKGNMKLLKLIKRLDLDRPLMLKEKLDIIWKEMKDTSTQNQSLINISQNSIQSGSEGENSSPLKSKNDKRTINLRAELDKRKESRLMLNIRQREIYNNLLQYLDDRCQNRGAISKEEKQYMNILKVVIDGGWVIREEDYSEILKMVSIQWEDNNIKETAKFLQYATNEFGFYNHQIIKAFRAKKLIY